MALRVTVLNPKFVRGAHREPRRRQSDRYAFRHSAFLCGLERRLPFRVTGSSNSAILAAGAPSAGACVGLRGIGPLARWWARSASFQHRASLAVAPLRWSQMPDLV